MIVQDKRSTHNRNGAEPLFVVEMNWGMQPVRLTGLRVQTLPTDAPVTSVHIVAFLGEHALLVKDRKGVYGFPGGRLDPGETREEAMKREVYEEANAHLAPEYTLFGVVKIEYTARVPGRSYPHNYSYMGMYVGAVHALDDFDKDPAGFIVERALFSHDECRTCLQPHDRILLQEALDALHAQSNGEHPILRAFLKG